MVYILIGVSGVGKTSVGKLLAYKLNCDFLDADDFHSQENIEKMCKGIPLNDSDRLPWLQNISDSIKQYENNNINLVLACSALKQNYRDRLKYPFVEFIHLSIEKELVLKRLSNRKGHFFNISLIESQFNTLEKPKQNVISVLSDDQIEDVCDKVLVLIKGTVSEK